MRIVQNADGSRAPFDFVTIALHWLTATLIVFQAASGAAVAFARDGVLLRAVLDFHRAGGVIVWCVVLTRIAWRSTFAEFPPFPDWMSNAQKWVATRMEYILYGLLFLQPVTGLAATLVLGEPFHLFFLTVPALFHPDLDLWEALVATHRAGAWGLLAAIGAHAGMALIHHYVWGDEVLERMAPWMRRERARLPIVVNHATGDAATSNDNRRAA
jgi:cytochrome b561